MSELIIQRAPEHPDIYCYDAPTNADQVNVTLHDIVVRYGMQKSIWVIAGTHGEADGTVTLVSGQKDFREEDLDTAYRTSTQIKILDYHLLAPSHWQEIRENPGGSNVIVLAFGYSEQWFLNNGPGGNDGKL
jgi:hypothetical protein